MANWQLFLTPQHQENADMVGKLLINTVSTKRGCRSCFRVCLPRRAIASSVLDRDVFSSTRAPLAFPKSYDWGMIIAKRHFEGGSHRDILIRARKQLFIMSVQNKDAIVTQGSQKTYVEAVC